jgi:hypothetical protein
VALQEVGLHGGEQRGDATPARMSDAGLGRRPRRRLSPAVTSTASIAPANAAAGSMNPPASDALPGHDRERRTEARPAATPSRYGSASGLRNTPW